MMASPLSGHAHSWKHVLRGLPWLTHELVEALEQPDDVLFLPSIAVGRLVRAGVERSSQGMLLTNWIVSLSADSIEQLGGMAMSLALNVEDTLAKLCASRSRLRNALREAYPSLRDERGDEIVDSVPLNFTEVCDLLGDRENVETLLFVLGEHASANADPDGRCISAEWERRVLDVCERLDDVAEVVRTPLILGVAPCGNEAAWLDVIAQLFPEAWWLRVWRMMRVRQEFKLRAYPPPPPLKLERPAATVLRAAGPSDKDPALLAPILFPRQKQKGAPITVKWLEELKSVGSTVIIRVNVSRESGLNLTEKSSIVVRDVDGQEIEAIRSSTLSPLVWWGEFDGAKPLLLLLPAFGFRLEIPIERV